MNFFRPILLLICFCITTAALCLCSKIANSFLVFSPRTTAKYRIHYLKLFKKELDFLIKILRKVVKYKTKKTIHDWRVAIPPLRSLRWQRAWWPLKQLWTRKMPWRVWFLVSSRTPICIMTWNRTREYLIYVIHFDCC